MSARGVVLRVVLAVGSITLLYAAAAAQESPKKPAEKAAAPPFDDPVRVADGVWFERHREVPIYGSNVGWIEFADFVVVVDTAYPVGAERALANIKKTTRGKPIRYAVITHYHGDHAMGTGVFAKGGTIVVSHENARRDFLAKNPGSYANKAKIDKAYARTKLAAPQLAFTDQFVIDDGRGRRAEVVFLGHAHTSGDVFVWLPKEKIVLTGDACVNGNHNFMGDSDSASWIDVLARLRALGPETVLPGHGALAKADVIDEQRAYFVELRAQVGALVKQGKTMEEIQTLVDIPRWKQWTGEAKMNPAAIRHVYQELTRGPAPNATIIGGPAPTAVAVAVAMPAGGEKPRLKFLTGALPPDQLAGVKQLAPNVDLVVVKNRDEALARAPEVHGMSSDFARPEILRAAEKLRWVQHLNAGVEQFVSIPELVDNDAIVLTNAKRIFGPNIADHAFALLLSLTRGLPRYLEHQKAGRWAKDEPLALQELGGKTMLLVGLGGIGQEVARRAAAFGMRVIAVDPKDLTVPSYVSRLEKPDKLAALLPAADVVVVAAPWTPKTNALFGAAQLALLKPTAYYINVSRGRIQDNRALAAALVAGKLAGVGLDVVDPEPMPPDHPLWKAPRLIVTPHVASRSPDLEARRRALFLENMRRFAAGEPLVNVVDKKLGY